MMASPTPSIDSLNSAAAVGSLCGLDQVIALLPGKCGWGFPTKAFKMVLLFRTTQVET